MNENVIEEGIFTTDENVTESLRENAEALGINPDLVAPEEKQLRYFARKNCKFCFGRGTLTVVVSPSKRKVFEGVAHTKGRLSKRKGHRRGPTQQRPKRILGVSPGYESDWNTCKPEPPEYKYENATQTFCKCVRGVEV